MLWIARFLVKRRHVSVCSSVWFSNVSSQPMTYDYVLMGDPKRLASYPDTNKYQYMVAERYTRERPARNTSLRVLRPLSHRFVHELADLANIE